MNAKQVARKYPELHAWFLAGKSDWAHKMMDNLRRYDRLTDSQIDASIRIKADEERKAAMAVLDQVNAEAASERYYVSVGKLERPTLEIAKIEEAFDKARANGVSMPKMSLDKFHFKAAGAHSANPGAIYITRGKGGEYLGKVLGGVLTTSRSCTQDDVKEIQDVLADPEKAANAYGMRTGICCICSRTLTAKESVDDGIGPICREKFGW
jgi:hypothetical protein